MQGTVWGSLICTSTMDQLPKLAYKNPEDLYMYKGVSIPPLEMVDDILTVTNVEKSLKMNQLVNTFIEHKRLKLSDSKCSRVHIGSDHSKCPPLKVHDSVMKDSQKEKYLGDIIDSSEKIQPTIDQRKAKGNGIVSEITSIITEIPFGKHKMEVAMKLREAMLINGILYNSEAWHGVTRKQIASLEAIDEALLRKLLKSHCKTPKEFLYLETGALPLRWIVAQRRILFLKHITEKHDDELLKKVFLAQKENPTQGDFWSLVKEDMADLKVSYEEVTSPGLSKTQLKLRIKKNAINAAFNNLKEVQLTHKKVKHIQYPRLEIQSYLKSEILTADETKQISAFRSNCVRGMRTHFRKMYPHTYCPLNCSDSTPYEDSSDHILVCSKLTSGAIPVQNIIKVYGDIKEQEDIGYTLSKLMRLRTNILDKAEDEDPSA